MHSENWVTWTGFPLRYIQLPNVEFFRAAVRKYDEILLQLGIDRVINREYFSTPYVNAKYNRYLRRSISRLHKHAKNCDHDRFVGLAYLLQSRSNVLRTLLLFKTFPRFYKELSSYEIMQALNKTTQILKEANADFEFKRVMIPKPNGKYRPLSVPPLHWRMVGKWYNLILQI
jgi:adenine-specific DNA methylase